MQEMFTRWIIISSALFFSHFVVHFSYTNIDFGEDICVCVCVQVFFLSTFDNRSLCSAVHFAVFFSSFSLTDDKLCYRQHIQFPCARSLGLVHVALAYGRALCSVARLCVSVWAGALFIFICISLGSWMLLDGWSFAFHVDISTLFISWLPLFLFHFRWFQPIRWHVGECTVHTPNAQRSPQCNVLSRHKQTIKRPTK